MTERELIWHGMIYWDLGWHARAFHEAVMQRDAGERITSPFTARGIRTKKDRHDRAKFRKV